MTGVKRTTMIAAVLFVGGGLARAEDKAKPAPSKAEAPKPSAADAAKPPGAMGPPPVPKEMDELKVFVGDWKCTGEGAGPEPGKTHKVTTENTIKADLGGYWQHVKHHELKTKENPMEFVAEGWWGYDAIAKTYTGLFAGTYGAYETRTSKGWQGDTLVWEGKLHGFMGTAEAPFKHTFVKKGDKEANEKFEVQMRGAWMTLQDNVCKKK